MMRVLLFPALRFDDVKEIRASNVDHAAADSLVRKRHGRCGTGIKGCRLTDLPGAVWKLFKCGAIDRVRHDIVRRRCHWQQDRDRNCKKSFPEHETSAFVELASPPFQGVDKRDSLRPRAPNCRW